MTVLYLILLLLGAICFAVSAFNVAVTKLNLQSLGFLCWILVPLIQTLVAL